MISRCLMPRTLNKYYYSSFIFLEILNKFLIRIVLNALLFTQSSITKFDIKTRFLGLIR